MQILTTRLYPPRGDVGIVARPVVQRLVELVESRCLTVIKAPAGYGKTTSMVECYRHLIERSCPAVWISLNEFDGSADEFAAYLERALITSGLAFGPDEDPAGGSSRPTVESPCAHFGVIFDQLSATLYVFLDDADAIYGRAAEGLLAALVQASGDKVHWVVGSRSAPGMPLARMRVLGHLGELDVEDLRLSENESREFLSTRSTFAVSDQLVKFSQDRTEGWPAGLQLVSIALQRCGGDEASLLARWSGRQRDVASFFREEVFARLDEDMQRFLLDTCVLGRFTAMLCDAMTGRDDGQRMIDRLEEGGLFVFTLDETDRWYRYQHLFAEFMVAILRDREPGRESALHLQASRWLATQGLVSEAIEHAIRSGDESYAVQLLDRVWHDLMREGEFVRSAHLVSSLAQETLNRFPRVQLWSAVCMIVESRFAEARALLSRIGQLLDRREADGEVDAQQLCEWRYMLLNRSMMLATFCDDIGEMERLSQQLLERQDEGDAFLQGTLQLCLLASQRERYRLRDCDALVASSRELFAGVEYRPMLVWHACIVGSLWMQRGRVDAAIAQYRGAVELARNCAQPGAESELLPMALTMLADALLESHERDEAKLLFERAEERANGIGIPDYWLARYVGRTRLVFAEGDLELAGRLLDEGHEVAVSRSFERLRWAVAHERIRQALAVADLRSAQRIGTDAGLPDDDTRLRPSSAVTNAQELEAMAWSRLAIVTGRHAEALRLLRAWIAFAESGGAQGAVVRLSVLAVRALHAAGDGRGALRLMQQTLEDAAQSGMVLCIVQEGEPIRSLAIRSLEAAEAGRMSAPFLQRLHDAMQIRAPLLAASASDSYVELDESAAPVEALTQREIEILRRVAHSMLYKEIADQLGLTEGSVKWYMQQIYGKLGVRRRQRAVEKGRLLGYL